MKPARDIRLGLSGLGVHKLRTFLSTLGVIFGVAAVVAMMAIGEGARREALEKYALLGVNNIIVREPPLSRQERLDARAGFSRGLSIQDARAIETVLEEVLVAAPQREVAVEAKVRDIVIQTTVVGTVPE